jgi:hypothetical protein
MFWVEGSSASKTMSAILYCLGIVSGVSMSAVVVIALGVWQLLQTVSSLRRSDMLHTFAMAVTIAACARREGVPKHQAKLAKLGLAASAFAVLTAPGLQRSGLLYLVVMLVIVEGVCPRRHCGACLRVKRSL